MKWKLLIMVMMMGISLLESVMATPSLTNSIISDTPLLNDTNSIFNITVTPNAECVGNTSWWTKSGATEKQILGLDFNVNETDNNFWDYTGNNNNATCISCPTYNASCGVDESGCVQFTAQQKINISSINIRLNSSNFSFFAFIKRLPHNTTGNEWLISDYDSSTAFNRGFTFGVATSCCFSTTNKTIFEYYNGSTRQKQIFGTSLILPNVNYQLGFTKIDLNSTHFNITLWINGINENSFIGFNNMTSMGLLYLANQLTTGLSAFNGSIDKVRIYNYALTPEQVNETYQTDLVKRAARLLPSQTTTGDIWTANSVCSNTTTYSSVARSNVTIRPTCLIDLQNATPTAYQNVYNCTYNRNYTLYDANNCGDVANITINESYSDVELLLNTTPTAWNNMSICSLYDIVLANRSYTTYDFNHCGFINQTYNVTENNTCSFCDNNSTISICNQEERKMWILGVAVLMFGFVFSLFKIAELWTFKIFDRNKEKDSIIKMFIVLSGVWILAGILALASNFAVDNSASANVITLLDTIYGGYIWVAIGSSVISGIILVINILQWLGVDIVGGFGRK